MTTDPPIVCVLVQRQDGRLIWWPKSDYERNPESGSFIVHDFRKSKQ